MRYGKLISAMVLLVALAIPVSLAAQEHSTKHHKYNLTDIGTLGGPNFFFNWSSYPMASWAVRGQLQAEWIRRLLTPCALTAQTASLSTRLNVREVL
jgi:hypothetical protein